ncbi:hypothetical protein C2S52_011406 [Perilla frutescens var. hirtella]|nr:hypothetical protein C2S52_011406 [Perilla frutescens var. hirtella]
MESRRITRSVMRKRKNLAGNLYEEREQGDGFIIHTQFKMCCKTLEFHSRLNLPAVALDIIGRSSRRITIEAEHSGWEFDCQYEYRNILPTNHPVCRITEGWSEVVDFFRIGQGDTLTFQRDMGDPLKFHLEVKKHPDAIKVEVGEWI